MALSLASFRRAHKLIARARDLAFRLRTRRLARELELALAIRRRGRPARQAAARKGAATKHRKRMEGLAK